MEIPGRPPVLSRRAATSLSRLLSPFSSLCKKLSGNGIFLLTSVKKLV